MEQGGGYRRGGYHRSEDAGVRQGYEARAFGAVLAPVSVHARRGGYDEFACCGIAVLGESGNAQMNDVGLLVPGCVVVNPVEVGP